MATAQAPRPGYDEAVTPRTALTPRAVVIGTALLFGAVLWVRHSELLVHTINLTEATPPVPAVAALLLLAVLHPLLSRLGRRLSLTRREMVLIYFFVAIGSMMASLGVMRMVVPCATVPFYFATSENNMELLQPHIPQWLYPADQEVIRTLWEATEGPVPWQAWLGPIAHWTLFLTLLWATMLCITVLVRRPWVENERLAFPLLYLPLDMTEGVAGESAGIPFFRDPLMWTGFAIAVVFNVINIVNSLNPAVPAPGRSYDLGALFTERPWSAMRPLRFDYRPEILGLGYVLGTIVGIGAILAWCHYAGMSLIAAGVYFVFLFGFAITYLRVRCETGTPSTWLFPYYQARKIPVALLGAERWLQIGGPSTMTVWAMLFFLSRGFFFSSSAWALEGYRAAEELRARARDWAIGGLIAVVLGLLMAWWMHLDTYYEYGGNVVESGGVAGGPRTRLTVNEYQSTAASIARPAGPDRPRSLAMGMGALITTVLVLLRIRYLRFPLHPLGYALAAAYSGQIWGGFFAIWLLKGAILRFGGVRTYKRLTPAFIGLALGHFFTMGIAWAAIGGRYGIAAERARVWFT